MHLSAPIAQSYPYSRDQFQIRKDNIEKRNQEIASYFTSLYDGKRIRYEDCLQKTCEKFYLTPYTVSQVLRKSKIKKVRH